MFKTKRRTLVTVTAVGTLLLAGALAATLLTTGNGNASDELNPTGGTVEYSAGHRPLAPDLTGTSLTGAPVKLSGYRGQTVVLNFWGSWCSPCRGESGTLALLDKRYGPQGVAFLGDDVGDTPANALAFTRGAGISYPSINDQGYAVVQRLSQVVPVSDTPTTVVIDKTGHIAGAIIGEVSYGGMTTLLRDAAVTQ